MIKALIFDLDGTLLNTLDDLAASVNFALGEMDYPKRSIDEVRQFVGNGIKKLIERAVPSDTSDVDTSKALEIFKTHYKEHSLDKTAPYDGIMEMLAEAKGRGFKIAIVSNKADFAVRGIAEHFFNGYADIALGERAEMAKKPAPDMVYSVMNTLGVSADECVFIGDSEVDVETAKNAKLTCVCVLWGFRDESALRASGGECFITEPMQIFDFL